MALLHFFAAVLPLFFIVFVTQVTATRQPHIVMIVSDDVGWNDASWNNPEVVTPHLHSLASQGIILNRSYAQPTCTPSRSSLLTGLYAHRTGLQHGPIGDLQPVGLPTNLTLLPQRLKEVGYQTHLVGKWHLGFCKTDYIPTRRGFDSFYGYYTGLETYDTHISSLITNQSVRGLDFWYKERPVLNENGTYSTYAYADRVSTLLRHHNRDKPLFLMYAFQTAHTPLLVPRRFFKKFSGVRNHKRRIYLAMLAAMDEAVGQLIRDLKAKDMFDQTLFVYTSDNGAKHMDVGGGSNFPLRGFKDSLWEGGIRVPGFIYSRKLHRRGYVDSSLIHISDWMPTFLEVAGYNWSHLDLDGISHAQTLLRGLPSKRSGLVVDIDEKSHKGAIIDGRYKMIIGSPEYCRHWYHPPYNHCKAHLKALKAAGPWWLYDVFSDPEEKYNLATRRLSVVQRLLPRFKAEMARLRPSVERPNNAKGMPRYNHGVWGPGWC